MLIKFLIGFQVATDKCIMLFLFLIVCGVIAIIVVKVCFLRRNTYCTYFMYLIKVLFFLKIFDEIIWDTFKVHFRRVEFLFELLKEM